MLFLSYVLFIQAHFPVCLPCYDLSLLIYLTLVIFAYGSVILEEGDGRCVRASWPSSIKHSILNLLLNPPLVSNFIGAFVRVLRFSWDKKM